MICFQISIFEPLNTAIRQERSKKKWLWFAFKLVSLSHWIQQKQISRHQPYVVICFQISIFEPLNTALGKNTLGDNKLWFAFKLVSLSHWIQQTSVYQNSGSVVICFQISIFEPLNTAMNTYANNTDTLWFAFKLVSLSHWIQHQL